MEIIGEGGMGAVYRAVHTLMGKEVALKVLLSEYSAVEGMARRFQQEAQSASRLEHPGIIDVFDFGETEDKLLFLVMAFLRGRPLTEIIEQDGPLEVERALGLGVQICDALAHAHEHGVVHRDLKPDNVMVLGSQDGGERVKLLDFGIAKITEGEGAATGMTEVGAVFGTPEYLSPEQAAGDPVDHRADIYSLGAIIYEMLASRRVFSADSNVKLLFAHIHDAPEPIRSVAPGAGVSPALDRAVLKALAKHPGERFQSAADLSRALAAAATGAPDSDGAGSVHGSGSPGAESAASSVGAHGRAPKEDGPRGVQRTQGDLGASEALAARPAPAEQARSGADAARVRRRLLWALGGGLGALLVLIMLVLSIPGGGEASKSADESQAAPRISLDLILGLMAAGRLEEASTWLQDLAVRTPKDPRVHLLLGHLYCKRGRADACLSSYSTALVLSASSRDDPQLLSNLRRLLTRRKGRLWGRPIRDRATSFALRIFAKGELSPAVVKMLTEYVNDWWEQDLIWKIIELLRSHEAAGGVSWAHAYRQRFRSVDSCELRKKYIQEMVARGDRRLLPLLGELYSKRSLRKPWSRRRVSNECISKEAARAIKTLGGALPPKERPRRRRAAGVGARLKRILRLR